MKPWTSGELPSVSDGGGVTSFRSGARRFSLSASIMAFGAPAASAQAQYVPSAQKPQDSAGAPVEEGIRWSCDDLCLVKRGRVC